jgi:hypothetical protein
LAGQTGSSDTDRDTDDPPQPTKPLLDGDYVIEGLREMPAIDQVLLRQGRELPHHSRPPRDLTGHAAKPQHLRWSLTGLRTPWARQSHGDAHNGAIFGGNESREGVQAKSEGRVGMGGDHPDVRAEDVQPEMGRSSGPG